jgi:uncharacterized protein (TIGR00661 family)
MKGKKINIPDFRPRVLVAPLDWGLGHTTRSIPVINGLLKQGCEVIVAAEGSCRILLEKEFPGLLFLNVRGYHIRYSRTGYGMPVKLLLQLPKIIIRAYKEHSWLKGIVKKHSIDAVISDNRLGMYHSAIPCIYITHQLKIKTGLRFIEWAAQKIHYCFINKYDECWVPDKPGDINLAGELSHPEVLPKIPVKYLGPISRFESGVTEKKYDLLIILSGPEPQRSVFEEMILKDLESYNGRVLLVRGLLGTVATVKTISSFLEIKNHLTAKELNLVMLQSQLIISRCGYTTVMDLIKLRKNAILIPTPGQTEQEYLAANLHKQKLFLCIDQASFSLPVVLKKAGGFAFSKQPFSQNYLDETIANFVLNML